MRVLITTIGSPSHGRAQLPLARALAAAGHTVLAVTTEVTATVFEHDDVQVAPRIEEMSPEAFISPEILDEVRDENGELSHDSLLLAMPKAMASGMAAQILEWVLPTAREFKPDLILRDGMDLSAVLIAELLGVPQLSTPSGASNIVDPAITLPGLNALRTKHGLPTQGDPLSVVPHGRIDYVPSAFSFAQHLPPSLAYRQSVAVDNSVVMPEWIAKLPTDRPLVLAGLGTALPMMRKLRDDHGQEPPFPMPDPEASLRTVLQAVSQLDDCTVVVPTLGLPADTSALPGHVHVTDRVPQPMLLEAVDVFLTHGGFNSIRESMRTATPMAVLPHFGDQPGNARRVQALGLGREITDTTADGIAGTVRAVLDDPAIRARARASRMAMLTLPEVGAAVADLEKIAGV